MAKKSKFKVGDVVHAKWKGKESVLITLIRYSPNYEWLAEFKSITENEIIRDYFDERDFD